MSERVKGILLALQERLERTPYPVYFGREFSDHEVDVAPMLSVFFAKDGEKSNETNLNDLAKALQDQELNLVIECHAAVDRDNPLFDLEDIHTEIKAELFDVADKRLAKGKIAMLKRRRCMPPPRGSDIGSVVIELKIPFHEEY